MNCPSVPLPADGLDAAAQLNRDCFCRTVDHDQLALALDGTAGAANELRGAVDADKAPPHSYASLRRTHPNLFSDTRVYVAQQHLDFMAELIRVVERVVHRPGWRERVLADAPAIAAHDPGTAGVMLGYDFHLGDDGPRLIEINTNAGGALLNSRLLAAQRACSPVNADGSAAYAADALPQAARLAAAACGADWRRLEDDFVATFRAEWALARHRHGGRPLARLAIVDEAPATQFLAPEFELFRQLFVAAGIACVVADPSELRFDGERLTHDGEVVDLIYNRLTDFALESPAHAALRAAYLADAVLLTPHPRAHALYADKGNLVALSDDDWLAAIGVDAADRRILAQGVPKTVRVDANDADAYWATRKQWFFKPRAGFGSRAAYRGDKLTKRVFAQIAQGGYIAQALVPPSERRLWVDGALQNLKLDLRNYAYRDRVQLVSARLYQGQTTNFRTPGGGFAAVFAVAG